MSSSHSDSDDEPGFGLDDLLPEPESPTPVPFSFATYEPPEGFSLDLRDDRRQVITRLVGSHPLWGHYLWNTSRVLSNYLLRNPPLYQGRRVLELGAGAGLPSLVSAVSGADAVVVTDYPDQPLVDNLRWNVDCNVPASLRDRVDVDGFVWGANVTSLLGKGKGKEVEGGKYDLIILSDLVFNHSQHPALISSVNALLAPTSSSSGPAPCLLVFFTHHRPHLAEADMAFFPALAESGDGWAYEQVVDEYAGAMFENDPGDATVRGTVKGWRAWRIQEGEEKGGKKCSA
ncbi:putative nicotinamide N-methyltransferase [Papiliotrema laurentii]|uniref:Nicotinamide N-methyltransferase n=1 Tax=Papiliotrema laurentii TaxID=5418 RepID=A0AAD9FWA9_PAPLA|nr:putative nicotinamide N-methyltransferase [Papiliotrema laurentii]